MKVIDNRSGGALTKVLPRQCGANTRALFYTGKKGREMKRQQTAGGNGNGFNEQSPQGGAFSGNLLDQNTKSPLFPGCVCGGGGGGVVTNA